MDCALVPTSSSLHPAADTDRLLGWSIHGQHHQPTVSGRAHGAEIPHRGHHWSASQLGYGAGFHGTRVHHQPQACHHFSQHYSTDFIDRSWLQSVREERAFAVHHTSHTRDDHDSRGGRQVCEAPTKPCPRGAGRYHGRCRKRCEQVCVAAVSAKYVFAQHSHGVGWKHVVQHPYSSEFRTRRSSALCAVWCVAFLLFWLL